LGTESQVLATAGKDHTLIVNGKGELYITSGTDQLPRIYWNIVREPQSTLRLIFSQPTTNCILQISANFGHAAFVIETGQVSKLFLSLKHSFEMNVKP
jgi:alpha-tubulin suppressor-like RCC1 family protein